MQQRKLAPPQEQELNEEAKEKWNQEQEVQNREKSRFPEEARQEVEQRLMIGLNLKRFVL